ncbi:MAG: hypothetical protein A3F78_03900 [Burkholderiales bacterium RIFCSPLOWO2_12_FULL_61_40]|nr:MAG: hypothetical protein A3F78_03900 [Burkholderiales bacterium RIFCSPLOWO2_12_FULL_61_40]
MKRQITRDNHYVPQWYQKGFLTKGRHKLHVRNLMPVMKTFPNGKTLLEPEVEELGPKLIFNEFDLYTTRFGEILNDDIETFLFGQIDKTGADAVRGWIAGDPIQVHRKFQEFFGYMDTQKLRTPKGLDWILKHYQSLPQVELMAQMQALRQMHCTMWCECVREIVSAAKSPVKFLVSDHPVTVFHPKLGPDVDECQYPGDPGIQMVSTQTIFALDANHCLILTNLEYAEDPAAADHMARRTNARFRGESMARTDAMVRGRELTEADVNAINLVLLSRAKQYVAAGRPEWLYPERNCSLSWEEIAKILLPRDGLWKFGGEMYIGYEDGTSAYRDKFGRTSRAHEFLAKPPLSSDPEPDAPCGCGGGLNFRDCCADILPQRRPSWRVMSIRERNLALIRGISKILELDDSEESWLRVRRTLSEDQVRRIYEVHAALWPTDTQLIDLLPSPQRKRSRALYLGMTDARTLSEKITGMLSYVDELVVVHPFMNANAVRKEFSPVHQPASFLDQTLRNVFALLVLERAILEGRVHLIPDPLDFDPGFRSEIIAITDRLGHKVELGPLDKAMARELGQDEMMRFVKRLPPDEMKAYIRRRVPAGAQELTDADIDSVVEAWGKEVERDPMALLTPPPTGQRGEVKTMKSFARETGLYVATLTGAFVYTDSDTQWERLHQTDGVHRYEQDPAAGAIIGNLTTLQIKVPTLTYHRESEPESVGITRAFLREVAVALRADAALDFGVKVTEPGLATAPEDEGLLTCRLRASLPVGGFQRTDVSRLVMTFGRLEDVPPVRLALFIEPILGSI